MSTKPKAAAGPELVEQSFNLKTAALAAADMAASAVYREMTPAGEDDDDGALAPSAWVCPDGEQKDGGADKGVPPAAVAEMAGFALANRDAPAEALYRHAAMQGLHSGRPDDWPDLPLAQRLAYRVFRDTVLAIDATLDAVTTPREDRPVLARRAVPVEDTILERGGSMFELVSFAQRKPEKRPRKKRLKKRK